MERVLRVGASVCDAGCALSELCARGMCARGVRGMRVQQVFARVERVWRGVRAAGIVRKKVCVRGLRAKLGCRLEPGMFSPRHTRFNLFLHCVLVCKFSMPRSVTSHLSRDFPIFPLPQSLRHPIIHSYSLHRPIHPPY